MFTVVSYAQNNQSNEEQIVTFNEKIHDFGDMLLTDGPKTCTFTMTNISDSPIVIHNVVSSCGCTIPEWSKAPIPKGGKATIKVTYLNDQGPYPFNKTITVYVSSVTRPVVLRIRGDVHEKILSLKEMYTCRIGSAFALKTDEYTLGYILQGAKKYDEAVVANLSSSPITVKTEAASDALEIEITPNPIPANSTAKMRYTVNTAKGEKNWGRTAYQTSFTVNGVKQTGTITVEANINDNFDSYTKTMLAKAPLPFIEKAYYEFGQVKKGQKVESSFLLKNSGKSDLVIHKIDSDKAGTVIDNKMPIVIKAGSTASIKFRFDTSGYEGEVLNVLNLITNAPTKPNINFFISGIIL